MLISAPTMSTFSKKHRNPDVIDAPDLAAPTRSGRVTWDERGNSIWEWQTAPGVFSREISDSQLEALEASDLRVVDLDQVSVRPVTGRLHIGERRSKQPKKSALERLLTKLGLPTS